MYKNAKKGEQVHHSVYGKGVFVGKTQTHYLVTFVGHGTQLIKIANHSDTLPTKNANQPCESINCLASWKNHYNQFRFDD